MQETINDFEKSHSIPQRINPGNRGEYIILTDRLGLHRFIRITGGPVDCCGFCYRWVKRDDD